MIKITCKTCDKEFEVKPYRKNTAKYCSQKCNPKAFKKNGIAWNKGKKCPQISKALKGRIFSKKAIEKMRDARKKYIQSHPYSGFQKGYKPTEEHKRKMRENHADFSGSKAPNWKGGITIDSYGYVLIKKPDHPFCNAIGYIREHRLVVEKQIGRYLEPLEVSHHINEIRNDNRPENLMLFKNAGYHHCFHKKGFCNPKGIIFDGRKL